MVMVLEKAKAEPVRVRTRHLHANISSIRELSGVEGEGGEAAVGLIQLPHHLIVDGKGEAGPGAETGEGEKAARRGIARRSRARRCSQGRRQRSLP